MTSGGRSADKSVTYWSMQATAGTFVASREVDEMRWLRLDAARKLLTSASDKKVLDLFVRAPRDTRPLLLIRHAETSTPARRLKRHAVPPGLSKSGREQAAALVPVLEGLGVTQLLSADLPACTQTLAPFAASSGVAVRREASLTRARFAGHERAAADDLREAIARDTLVICGQQRVIAGLLSTLGEGSGLRPPPQPNVRKGGWWLSTTGAAPSGPTSGTSRLPDDNGECMPSPGKTVAHLEIEAKYDVTDGQHAAGPGRHGRGRRPS